MHDRTSYIELARVTKSNSGAVKSADPSLTLASDGSTADTTYVVKTNYHQPKSVSRPKKSFNVDTNLLDIQVFELVEGLQALQAHVAMIRPLSHEVSALINGLTSVRWFYNVVDSEKQQLDLVSKGAQAVLDANQNR